MRNDKFNNFRNSATCNCYYLSSFIQDINGISITTKQNLNKNNFIK